MDKIFFIINPDGKVFPETVSTDENICLQKFARVWFSGWGINPGAYESGVIWRMFKDAGFKILEVELPAKLEKA